MVVGCSSCAQPDCPLNDNECSVCPEGHRVITGWVFSFVCALVFIFPIALAGVGSIMFLGNKTYGLLGGIVGFLLGWIISTLITRVCSIEK